MLKLGSGWMVCGSGSACLVRVLGLVARMVGVCGWPSCEVGRCGGLWGMGMRGVWGVGRGWELGERNSVDNSGARGQSVDNEGGDGVGWCWEGP